MRKSFNLASIIICIFVLTKLIVAQYETNNDKVNTDNLNIQKIKLNIDETVFKGKIETEAVAKKHRKQRIKKQDPIIGLKQQQYEKSSRSRSSRVINLPDNWEKNPFILQTYKYIKPIFV